MHIVTLKNPVKNTRWNLEAGSYLCEDLSAHELAIDAERGDATVNHFTPPESVVTSNTLLICNGGFGDLMFLTPALRRHKELYPFHRLVISTRKRAHCVFDGLPYAPELIDYPVPKSVADTFNRILTTEHHHSGMAKRFTMHATDINAEVLGVGPLVGEQRKVEYIVSPDEAIWAQAAHPHGTSKRIGIQLAASSPTRSYHPKRAGEVMRLLYEKGYELFLLGTPGSIPKEVVPERIRDRVINLTADNLTFRQSAAVLATVDCAWAPDSSLLHIAGALNIPAVGIFASTHWKLRTADFTSVLSIQSNMGCNAAPCFFHPRGHHLWPDGEICAKEGHCVPLSSIDPETIVGKIQKQLSRR